MLRKNSTANPTALLIFHSTASKEGCLTTDCRKKQTAFACIRLLFRKYYQLHMRQLLQTHSFRRDTFLPSPHIIRPCMPLRFLVLWLFCLLILWNPLSLPSSHLQAAYASLSHPPLPLPFLAFLQHPATSFLPRAKIRTTTLLNSFWMLIPPSFTEGS